MAMVALRRILAWGVPRIQQSLSLLTDRVAEHAAAGGYAVQPREQRCPPKIGFRLPNGIPAGLTKAFEEAKVFLSIRGDAVRIAPHLYNDLRDIDRVFEILKGCGV